MAMRMLEVGIYREIEIALAQHTSSGKNYLGVNAIGSDILLEPLLK